MKNFENMVEYYRNHPEECRAILKHAGLLNEEPMNEDRNDFPKEETRNPDEIIVRDIDMVHFEMMGPDSIWCGIYHKSGRIDHFNVIVKGKKLDTLWTPRTGHMDPDKL